MYFCKLNSGMFLELLYHPQFLCDRIFCNAILAIMAFFVTLSICCNNTSTRNRSSIMVYPQGHICTWHGNRSTLPRTCSSSCDGSCFSDDNSDHHEVHGQQEGDNIDCDVTFGTSLRFLLRASWAKCKERESQQDATIRCLLSTSVSTCFGHHYVHLQEDKDRVIVYGILCWFWWMWLVAVVGRCVVGCEQCCSKYSITQPWNSLFTYGAHQTKTHKIFCYDNESK